MSITQISAFVENKPGRFKHLTEILEQANISIRGFSLADTQDFGIARIVVDQPLRAKQALEAAGVLIKTAELLCIQLPDQPGALDEVFDAIAKADINVEYAYSLVSTYIAVKVEDIDEAKNLLAEFSLRTVNHADLEKRF